MSHVLGIKYESPDHELISNKCLPAIYCDMISNWATKNRMPNICIYNQINRKLINYHFSITNSLQMNSVLLNINKWKEKKNVSSKKKKTINLQESRISNKNTNLFSLILYHSEHIYCNSCILLTAVATPQTGRSKKWVS